MDASVSAPVPFYRHIWDEELRRGVHFILMMAGWRRLATAACSGARSGDAAVVLQCCSHRVT